MCPPLNQVMEGIQEGTEHRIKTIYNHDSRRKLVSSLVQLEKEKLKQEMADSELRERTNSFEQLMRCPICNGICVEPITISCGHTFCNFCIRDEFSSPFCWVCQSKTIQETQAVNFLLCNISTKWLPKQCNLHHIKTTAQRFILENNHEKALGLLNTAIENNMKLDCNFYYLRGDCNYAMGHLDMALQDMEAALQLSPFAVHVLYKKTRILVEMGNHFNALSIYIRLCAVQPHNVKLKEELEVTLNNLLHIDLKSLKETMKKGFPTSLKNHDDFLSERTQNTNAFDISDSSYVMKRETSGEQSVAFGIEMVSMEEDFEKPSTPNVEEFDCKLCCSLLFKPVTSRCGHTFCDECLQRSLDFRVDCPCCRRPLTEYLADRKHNVTVVIENIIKSLYPREYTSRKESIEQEMESMHSVGKSSEFEVPIFICTLAFPSVLCPLHIFEPRYKLMIRRCMESGTKQFGMCAPNPDDNGPCATMGTMLRITDIAYLPDGRSLINTEGVRRFQVISSKMKDGYTIAKVKWLDDEVIVSEEEKSEIWKLHANGYELLEFWFRNQPKEQKECIINAIGDIPRLEELHHIQSDQPNWLWWALAALPLNDKPKLIILSMTSMLERLRSLWRFLIIVIKLQGRSASKDKPN